MNTIVLIDVSAEMSTDVGAPLLVNVAVLLGTNGLELQLKPVVHCTPGPSQVPSIACADVAASNAAAAAVLNNKYVRTSLPPPRNQSRDRPANFAYAGVQGKGLQGHATTIVLRLWFSRNVSRELFYGA